MPPRRAVQIDQYRFAPNFSRPAGRQCAVAAQLCVSEAHVAASNEFDELLSTVKSTKEERSYVLLLNPLDLRVLLPAAATLGSF